MMTRRLLMGLAIAFAATSGGRAGAAVVYDLAGDFSTAQNPNGVWTYGRYASALSPATFTAFTVSGDLNTELGSSPQNDPAYKDLVFWKDPGNIDPNIIFNQSGSDISTAPNFGDITFKAQSVTFGPFLGPTVARFTAQFAGEYSISAIFTPTQVGNTPPFAYVYRGLSQIFGPPTAVPSSYTDTLTLTSGETLDFVVWGANGANKTTQVDVTITAVPEPASLAMGGTALLAVGGLSWRLRRRAKSAPAC